MKRNNDSNASGHIRQKHPMLQHLLFLALLLGLSSTRRLFVLGLVAPRLSTQTGTMMAQGLESRFFLDTANVKEWEELIPTGIFHGITTNPTLMERAKEPCTIDNLRRLADHAINKLGVQEFMGQAWGTTADELYECGMALSQKDRKRFVVKVPVTLIGTQAATRLIQSKVRVCLTAGYDASQAMIAARIGAEYIAPYFGRMMDAKKDGWMECTQMQATVKEMQCPTRILVASIRDVQTLHLLTLRGMETATFAPAVVRELFGQPLTEAAAREFQRAATAGDPLCASTSAF